jgi:hypothetical protein
MRTEVKTSVSVLEDELKLPNINVSTDIYDAKCV